MKLKQVTVQYLDPFSLAKIVACIYGLTGPIAGFGVYIAYIAISALFYQTSGNQVSSSAGLAQIDKGVSFLVFVMVFILYVISGFFIGFIGALVYNWVSKFTGGVKIVIKE